MRCVYLKPRSNGVFIVFMFTGIVTEVGTITERSKSAISIRAREPFVRRLTRGASVAVDGVCLTVTAKKKSVFSAEIMEETMRRTTLGRPVPRARVNLELPATPTSFLAGHIVQGHVDGIGTLLNIENKENSRVLKFSIPQKLSKYIVEKGSIAISGVSLTVVHAGKRSCAVSIIPHTRDATSIGSLKVGDEANIEVDILAKYKNSGFVNPNIGNPKKKPRDMHIGIIGSSFREEVTKELEKRCTATLCKRGVSRQNITMVRVPGAFEIPLVAKKMAKQRAYDALIVFGAILKGKTYHFEQVAHECAHGCAEVSRAYEIPVIFEVLAVYDIADALERAKRTRENKGVEAAETAITMIRTLSKL